MDLTAPATRSFPTLAEQLGSAEEPDRPLAPPVAIWIEADEAADVTATLAQARQAFPTAALVAVVSRGEAHTGEDRAPLRTLEDVSALLAQTPEVDLVVVDERREVDAATIADLAEAAHEDSVCATVSHVGPHPPGERRGIPPAPVDSPRWGLVYVRRDALDIALGEAVALGEDVGERTSVQELMTPLLVHPGLVHRSAGGVTAQATESRSRGSSASSLRVTMDVRHLVAPLTGTQVQSLALLEALVRTGEVELAALAPDSIHPSATSHVERLREHVAFSTRAPVATTDIFYRPHQVGSLDELGECLAYGPRFVLTHQDMIGDRTPVYFASPEILMTVRETTRSALAAADHVGFFSTHAALDAASEGVLDPERATVVPLGVDHITADGPVEHPPGLEALGGRPFVLVLGTSFRHKNRLFAVRVVRELIERGWEGALVLAGRDVPFGSSLEDERRLLGADRRLRERVVVIDHVSESAKRGLYRDASLVLFPSLFEGFGLVPFEAAVFGTPCLYGWRGAVAEFLPRTGGALPPDFSVAQTASMITELLEDDAAQEALVSDIRAAAAGLTWDDTARGYLEVFRRALEGPPVPIERSLAGRIGLAADNIPLSPMERAAIRVYRRRPVFRKAVDTMVRVGGLTTRATRLGR